MNLGRLHFSNSFWSGNWMVGVDEGRALRMDVRNYEGYDFIIIEQPDFERALKDGDTNNIPSDFHPGLSGYIRAKE